MKQVTGRQPHTNFGMSFVKRMFDAIMSKTHPKAKTFDDHGSHLCQPFGGKKGRHKSSSDARAARRARA